MWKAGEELKTGKFAVRVHRRAAPRIKRYALKQIGKTIGADRQMRNFPRPPGRAKLGMRYDVKGDDLILQFASPGMAKIVFEGNRYGGGPANPRALYATARESGELWQDAFRQEWFRRVR